MSKVNKPHEIPNHWQWRRLDQVGDIRSGSTPSTKEDDNFGGDIPWLTPGDLSDYDEKYVRRGERNLTQKGLESCSAALLPEGSILFSSRAPIGYTVIAQNPISTNQGFKNLIPSDGIDSEYAYHYLKGSKGLAESYASGTTFKELSATRFARIPIPVPPLSEQRRIVAKIEELFSNLDAGMDDLQTAQQQLERYRLSVLQAAVEGRLTADWRRTHDPEPADQLLERILEEREKKWYKSRYKEPVEPEFGNSFPGSPDGWTLTSFDAVLSHVTSGPRGWSDYYHEGDGVFILAQNVRPGRLDFSETKNVNPPDDASGRDRAMVEKNDLLVTIVGANTGDVCRVDHELHEYWVCQSVALMRPALPEMSKYLELYLNSQTGQQQYERFAYGQGRPHLNFGQLKTTPLLLPPLAEQKQIITEVERLLSVADDAAATTGREHTRAERLRQSILKHAFSGQLVPHDEDAEPPALDVVSASNGSGTSSSSSTKDRSTADSGLFKGVDPDKQIEMDL
jgi:type I restriction enzyme S subunit